MDTLEEVLGKSYDDAQAADPAPVVNEEPPELENNPAPVEPDNEAPAVDGVIPDRDERGRFRGKGKPDDEPVTAPVEGVQNTPPPPASEAPASWSPAAKAKWAELPPEVRAEAHKRESDAMRQIQAYAQKVKQFDGLAEVLEPRKAEIERFYGSTAAGVKHLMELSDYSQKDPMGFIRWFAQSRGIDLSSGVNGGQSAPPAPQANNNEARIFSELDTIKNTLHQEKVAAVEAQIRAFAVDKPYFNNQAVKDRMAALLDAGQAQALPDAYEQAIWSLPEIREALTAERAKEASAAATAEASKRLKAARQAGAVASATGQSMPTAAAGTAKSMDDVLSDVYDRMATAS